MSTSERFRLPGVLDTFVVEGTPSNYNIRSVSGTTYATVVNGVTQSNSDDIIFNRNLANNDPRYTASINNALSSLSGTSSNQNAATTNPNQLQSSSTGRTSPGLSRRTRSQREGGRALVYPSKMLEDQDHIRFEVWKLKKSPVSSTNNLPSAFSPKSGYGIKGDQDLFEKLNVPPIILPIQASITDNNIANWGAGELNELSRMLVEASLTTMTSKKDIMGAFNQGLDKIVNTISGLPENQVKNAIYTALAEQAVGIPGLTSRALGGVLNPNMELLFQGPQLRPFNFTFKLSPRNITEADTIRSIIKTFKINMAPKVNGMFLEAPNVFKIRYYHGKSNREHQSINLIKMCSLQNFSVDYTPLQTYMTIDDGEGGDPKASMVSYTINMTLSEINPIYQQDYTASDTKDHSIGF